MTKQESLRDAVTRLVQKRFGLPVELGTEYCLDYLNRNCLCGDCFSYEGCKVALAIITRIAGAYCNTPLRGACAAPTKDSLKNYVAGLFDGLLV